MSFVAGTIFVVVTVFVAVTRLPFTVDVVFTVVVVVTVLYRRFWWRVEVGPDGLVVRGLRTIRRRPALLRDARLVGRASQLRVEVCSERSSERRAGNGIRSRSDWWARMLATSPSAKRP